MNQIKRTPQKSIALAALIASIGLLPTVTFGAEVNLRSADGTTDITGEYIEFVDNHYLVQTGLGTLRIAAEGVICSGPGCPQTDVAAADVRFGGSDTVGVGLMPLLMSGYAGSQGAQLTTTPTGTSDEVLEEIIGDDGFGDPIGSFLVTSTGSSDAFRKLLNGNAEIGMASRRIRPQEARDLRAAGAGNMVDPSQEHIVAIDSLVVITHPDNPVASLKIADVRDIYAGRITNWADVGGPDAPITVVTRKEGSGTRAVFESRVFGDQEPSTIGNARIAEGNTSMTTIVNEDENAIGFVGYAFQRGARPVTLLNQCGLSMTPDSFSARTEEYSLQRFLYLYTRADTISAPAQAFLDFAASEEADGVIAKSGFIDLGIDRREQALDGNRARLLLDPTVDAFEGGVMREMLAQMVDYDRLSSTFRFPTGSSQLNRRGQLNLQRLTNYLEKQESGTKVLLVGFTDSIGAFESNRALSIGRAEQVREELLAFAGDRFGDIQIDATGFGEIAPAACNTDDNGRRINRRVEVWIQSQNG